MVAVGMEREAMAAVVKAAEMTVAVVGEVVSEAEAMAVGARAAAGREAAGGWWRCWGRR